MVYHARPIAMTSKLTSITWSTLERFMRYRRSRPSVCCLLMVFLLSGLVIAHAQQPNYDVIISNGRIVDGTGAAYFYGDVAIEGDRIAAIGDLHNAKANQHIDARGLVVAPGFIDVQGQSEFNILVDGRAASKITQGVTTEITGEGTSIAPVNERMIGDLRANAEK